MAYLNKITIELLNAIRPKPTNLIAIRYAESMVYKERKKIVGMVECECVCGKLKTIKTSYFKKGRHASCGCLTYLGEDRRFCELERRLSFVIKRCYDPKHHAYKYYGGRGVEVCKEWREDNRKFCKWALENGYSKELQLDKDIKGNGLLYSPDTCVWVTKKENLTVKAFRYEIGGSFFTISEIAKKFNSKRHIVKDRLLKKKMTIPELLKSLNVRLK